jgi:hypothetical protein
MVDVGIVGWIVAVVALLAFGGLLYWLIDIVSSDRLMRCPETGSVTFVRVGPAAGGDGNAPEVAVQRCDLWPGKKDCARGCLARYGESAPGLRVNLNALRPFEPQ